MREKGLKLRKLPMVCTHAPNSRTHFLGSNFHPFYYFENMIIPELFDHFPGIIAKFNPVTLFSASIVLNEMATMVSAFSFHYIDLSVKCDTYNAFKEVHEAPPFCVVIIGNLSTALRLILRRWVYRWLRVCFTMTSPCQHVPAYVGFQRGNTHACG